MWANGESRTARVISGRTTAAGNVTIGQTVRFWLEFDAVPPQGTPSSCARVVRSRSSRCGSELEPVA